jgi:hypothetical protein
MTTPDLHQLWQQTLSDWQASGLSGAAYCKQESRQASAVMWQIVLV